VSETTVKGLPGGREDFDGNGGSEKWMGLPRPSYWHFSDVASLEYAPPHTTWCKLRGLSSGDYESFSVTGDQRNEKWWEWSKMHTRHRIVASQHIINENFPEGRQLNIQVVKKLSVLLELGCSWLSPQKPSNGNYSNSQFLRIHFPATHLSEIQFNINILATYPYLVV
jgi:hypothetical protein